MNTIKWGGHGWNTAHKLVDSLPDKLSQEEQDWVELFFITMSFVLPCKYCRQSFAIFLKQNPISPHLSTREQMRKWLYIMHNLVNNKLRKQKKGTGEYFSPDPSYSVAMKRIGAISQGQFNQSLWLFLHAISMNYQKNPTVGKEIPYLVFFTALGHLLNSPRYSKAMVNMPTYLASPNTFFRDLYGVRKMVDPGAPEFKEVHTVVGSWKAKCKVFKGWSGGTCR